MVDRCKTEFNIDDDKLTLYVDSFQGCSKLLLRARTILSRFPPHSLTLARAPGEADVILYMEEGYLGLGDLRAVARRTGAQPAALHVLFSESDWPYPILPSACPSLTRRCGWADGWAFLIDLPVRAGLPSRDGAEPRHLFSFLGRVSTHPIRREILLLDAFDTPCLDLAAAPGRLPAFDVERSYIDLIDRSQFVLCPRGFGASSIRIYEAMFRGRVPVIVGDAWRPPPGPDWDTFSVRIPECQVGLIPEVLASLSPHAAAMGARAAAAFDAHYAPDVFFDRLVGFLWHKYRREPATLPALGVRAVSALGWRELKTVAHALRHRRS